MNMNIFNILMFGISLLGIFMAMIFAYMDIKGEFPKRVR